MLTHPEYSHSHRTKELQARQARRTFGWSPTSEQVDAYVNERLKYERDKTAIELLNLEKQLFGSGSETAKGFQNEPVPKLTGKTGINPQDLDLIAKALSSLPVITLLKAQPCSHGPASRNSSQWPRAMVRAFFQWYDSFLQNNPLIIDPDALEEHHDLIRKHAEYFLRAGLSIDQFTRIMRVGDHRLKSEGGLHTGEGEGRGGWWNNEWNKFVDQNPEPNEEKIRKKLTEMEKAEKERKRLRGR